jgi:hypothetical protein
MSTHKYINLLDYYKSKNNIDGYFFDIDEYFENMLQVNNIEQLLTISNNNSKILKEYNNEFKNLFLNYPVFIVNIFEKFKEIKTKLDAVMELENELIQCLDKIV